MIKKALANLLVRKAAVFSGVLAIALAVMGGTLANQYDTETIHSSLQAAFVSENVARKLPAPVAQSYTPSPQGESIFDSLSLVSVAYSDEVIDGQLPGGDRTERDSAYYSNEQDTDLSMAKTNRTIKKSTQADLSEFVYTPDIPLSEELQLFTYEQCVEQDIDYTLVLAVMWRESRFKTGVVNVNRNGTRDSGIMQINDVNKGWLAKELGITDLMDPKQNIIAGTTMLGRLTEKYGEHNALMAYQYGEGGMQRKLSQGVTTNKQIQLVYTKQADFAALLK